MAYKRKTRDVWRIYVNYGCGWEYEIAELTLEEARKRMREYELNCPQYPVKIVNGRDRIEEGAAK